MTSTRIARIALALAAALPACATTKAEWDNDSAASARKLEVQVDSKGVRREIEYHIAPAEVPKAVRDAMDRLHPGGPFDDAEKETHGGVLYYELSGKVNGMEVEAMFTADGRLHSEEIQVAQVSVPASVRDGAASALAGARPTKWEEIRDGRRTCIEYHVKMARGEDRYKVILTPDGQLLAIYREVPAEIEVPVGTR